MNAVEYCLLGGLKTSGPERPAIVCAEESLTYGALVVRVARFAEGLREAGVRPYDRVAMMMIDTPDLVALHLAAMAEGAIAVVLSTRATVYELGQILAIVRPSALIVDAEFADVASNSIAAASPTTTLLGRDRELCAWKARSETDVAVTPRKPTDPAFWVVTSGTTGQPKAVEHRHDNVRICSQYYEQVLATTRADRLLATSRFSYAYALGNMFAALRLGATNILLEHWATADTVAATVERFAPTILLSVPAVYHKLLDAGLARTRVFRGVRYFVSAGERLPPKIWTEWQEQSEHPILDGMSCSELVYMVMANTPTSFRPGSSGKAMPSVELRIVGETGIVVAQPGQTGQLAVRMPSLCAGYRSTDSEPGDPPQRPEDRFKPDGWFMTGDEYLRDEEGFYHHRGRIDDMLRVSSIWISPSEIEDALAGVTSIAESAAVMGESAIGLAEIVLFIVPAPNTDAATVVAAAREHLTHALPHYKLPRRFEVVADLPRTATGKVQRHRLRGSLLPRH
jgi:3-hydroxybenzoate/4-hydroxybenzoate---CoA ligase